MAWSSPSISPKARSRPSTVEPARSSKISTATRPCCPDPHYMTRIWDRIRDWVVLFVLLVASIGVMLAQNEPIVRTLRATALDTTAWVESQFAWAGGFFRALDENRFLREENIQLASEVARSQIGRASCRGRGERCGGAV